MTNPAFCVYIDTTRHRLDMEFLCWLTARDGQPADLSKLILADKTNMAAGTFRFSFLCCALRCFYASLFPVIAYVVLMNCFSQIQSQEFPSTKINCVKLAATIATVLCCSCPTARPLWNPMLRASWASKGSKSFLAFCSWTSQKSKPWFLCFFAVVFHCPCWATLLLFYCCVFV